MRAATGAAAVVLALLGACASYPPASFPGGTSGSGTPAAQGRPAPGGTQAPAPRTGATPAPAASGPAASPGAARNAAASAANAQSLEAAARRAAASEQVNLQLQAARNWVQSGKPGEAARVLGALPAQLTPAQGIERRALQAELTLAGGKSQQAWQEITAVAAPSGTPGEAGYYESRMRIALAAARPVDGVKAELAAERATRDAAQVARLREALLQSLRDARERGVKLEAEASQEPTVRGWLELGALAGGGKSVAAASTAARWRAEYPDHPATRLLPDALPAELPAAARLRRIALLLPLTGPASGYATIVRAGFDYARSQLPEGGRPELTVVDTSTVPVADALRQARSEGADFVVGPLTRPEVEAAAGAGGGLPTLALNYVASARAPSGFYQFALNPEDEARAVARRILASGARRGATLVPTGEWGTRVLNAFTAELQAGGGSVASQASYDPASHDFTGPIRTVLATDRSYARKQRLDALAGKLEFEPRARADLDFIFAPGQSASVRLVRPQLRYQYAGSVPVYATSDAYAIDGGVANQDLEGLILPAMPWLVPGSTAESVHAALAAQASPDDTSWQSGLYAFGYDALQLALGLSAGGPRGELRIAGLTGQLGIDGDGRVRREPLWARIGRTGEPQPLAAGAVLATPAASSAE